LIVLTDNLVLSLLELGNGTFSHSILE
jgi:hypothetical protein